MILLAAFDAIAWLVAIAFFTSWRLDKAGVPVAWNRVLAVSVIAGVLQLVVGRLVRLHHGRAALGSVEEMTLLGVVTASVGVLLSLGNLALPQLIVPRSVPVAATFMALAIAAWGRVSWRRLRESSMEREPNETSQSVLVLGAGSGGRQLVDSMRRDPAGAWRPVGFLDDDRLKRHRRFRGLSVLGTSSDLAEVAAQTGCRTLVIAIPSASAELVREIGARAAEAGLELKVLPSVADLFGGRVDVSDIRDVDVTDLLGRRQIDTDIASVAGYLTGQRVLVTGAGGSIGSELCRQIYRYGPAELIMLDRDESALHAVQLSIYGFAALDSPDVILADIRDTQHIIELMQRRRPHVVFHAAALKHLTMLEQYPGEAIKTNVWGTLSVLEAAKASGVGRFVNISTDKAANPCSVLGYSKRLAEGLTATVAAEADSTFLSVRFGNVLGSRGSVLTTFAAQIEAGGPVTVTNEDVTRYFMTVQEAVQLVIQAAAIGRGGEVLVLDMGAPVRIADVAKQLVEVSGRRIEIVYTGLHPGEKLHEELFADNEPDERPAHPLVSHVSVPRASIVDALELDAWAGRADVRRALQQSCSAMEAMTAPGGARA